MMEIQEIEVSKLRPWEENPRINDHAVETVSNSIQKYGFNVPILYDQDFVIIAGHTRWKAARKLGMNRVPAIQIVMDESKRKAFSVADNKTAEIAEWDFSKLKKIIQELKVEDYKIEDLGFSKVDYKKMMDEIERKLGVNDNKIPELSDQKSTIMSGDIIHLGPHRLLCGDSTDEGCLKALIQGEMVDHVFGGPPYFNQRQYAQWVDFKSYLDDMAKIIKNASTVLKDGGVIVWNIANDCAEKIDLTSHHSIILEQSGLSYMDYIVWYKPGANYSIPRNLHITRNRYYYPAFQWEALLVYQKPGEMPQMSFDSMNYMRAHHTNVWMITAITNQVKNFGHPAVCPVEIPFRSILAYTQNGGTVFEPFGGSGTTLIAAEKAGRRALLIERNPQYCDIIIKRWEDLTGKKADLAHA